MRPLYFLPLLWVALACTAELSSSDTGPGSDGSTEASGGSWGSGGTMAAAGGTASGGSTTGDSVTFAQVSLLIQRSCATNDCHGGKEDPDMQDPAGYAALLFGTFVDECGGNPLVSPGEPQNSALLLLVQRQCGELFMPDNCTRDPCLPQTSIDTLGSWISAGAKVQ